MSKNNKPKAATPGFDLKPAELKRQPELTGGKIEEISVKSATAAINDPRLKELEQNEAAELQRIMVASMQAIPGLVQREQPPQQIEQPPQPVQRQQVALPSPTPALSAPAKIFFTGRLGIGKDYCAAAAGYSVIGFADPIYQLANHFFGTAVSATEGKDAPGMRAFLQTVGQWGRGEVNSQYPYSPLRAIFVTMIRSMAATGALPDSKSWEQFGSYNNFWIDRMLTRTNAAPGRLAITNCRFENEFTQLKANGWAAYHIIASPSAWAARLTAKKLTPQSPELNDMSEALAKKLDGDVVKILSSQRNGAKLRVIWNDPSVPPPSNRLLTLKEFIEMAKP